MKYAVHEYKIRNLVLLVIQIKGSSRHIDDLLATGCTRKCDDLLVSVCHVNESHNPLIKKRPQKIKRVL